MLNPLDWYWTVQGVAGQVWHSGRAQFVATSDAAYVTWAGGNFTHAIAAADLYDWLLANWAPLVATSVSITSTATPALNGTYRLDPASSQKIIALSTGIAAGKPLPGGGSTFNYPDAGNVMHAFTAANFLNFAAAVETFLYSFEQSLLTLLNGGSATLPSAALAIA